MIGPVASSAPQHEDLSGDSHARQVLTFRFHRWFASCHGGKLREALIGDMAGLAVFNRALSDQEVKTLHAAAQR